MTGNKANIVNSHERLLAIDSARLNLAIDSDRLVAEMAAINLKWQSFSSDPHPHAQQNHYWHAIALTSSTGHEKDDYASRSAPIFNCNKLTPIVQKMPTALNLLKQFAPVTRCRLYRLDAGGEIAPHIDDNIREYGLARLIVPIRSQSCITTVGNSIVEMVPGSCWYLNDSRMHSVDNRGSSLDRVVLVIQSYALDIVSTLIN